VATVATALAATALFRLGLLPGGLVGIDVILAALGWWFASGGAGVAGLRRRTALAWSTVWRPLIAAIVLTIGWVGVATPTRLDPLVRGEVLATLGGYANWHQLSLGPIEQLSSRVDAPMQHAWALAVVVQCLLVWFVAVAATRGRAASRPDRHDPAVTAGLVLVVGGVVGGIALVVSGASGQALMLATPVRAVAFFLGAIAGAAGNSRWGASLRAKVLPARWLGVAGLALAAVFGSPTSDIGRWGWAVLVPILAAIVVVAALAWPPSTGDDGPHTVTEGWSALVAAWVLLTPSVAFVRAAFADAPAVLVGLAGLAVAAAATALVVWLGSIASMDGRAVERRRVLVPPLVVALLVALFSLTGAFHWEAPQTREQWEASAR